MGLIRKAESTVADCPQQVPAPAEAATIASLEPTALRNQYRALNHDDKRQLLKTLAAMPEALPFLVDQVLVEEHPLLQQSFFDSLVSLARIDGQANDVVGSVLRLLREGDASRRSLAVRFLSAFPEACAQIVPDLLQDPDVDTRLYALDIIQHLVHPQVPLWLANVLEQETHPNVIASAIDRSLEAGCTELQPLFDKVARRFSQVPFVQFSIRLAQQRLGGISQ